LAKRVLIAAGGTGGHFYPGFVLAQALKERGWEPLFFLRSDDPAAPTLEKAGIACVEVRLRGMPRSPGLPLLLFFRDLARAVALSRRVVRDFRPDAVIGMGGYLTFPAVAAAALRGIPRALHESNAVPGLANAAAAKLGAAMYWGLPPLSGEGEVVGTPIRQALWTRGDAAAARRELGLDPAATTILVFGGSQGAKGLNERAPGILKTRPGVQVLHLAGRSTTPEVEARYAGFPAKVLPFLDRMELAYAAADLVVCRSGASTIAELAAQKKPAVLVPFPSAAGNHQELNARVVEKTGACRVVLEKDLEARLAGAVDELLASPSAGEKYAALGLPAPERCAAALAGAVERLIQ
jgi:UDP-N-acetylglucosamine--N-acetylmuramyl-(pentapeptide) pyrophosphoryl-undecaprenol N-acetylglucosamine transferase